MNFLLLPPKLMGVPADTALRVCVPVNCLEEAMRNAYYNPLSTDSSSCSTQATKVKLVLLLQSCCVPTAPAIAAGMLRSLDCPTEGTEQGGPQD